VIVNFVMTADAKISTRNRTPSNFSSKADKCRLLEIRSLGDAVMVGRVTVATDAMSMGISDANLRKERVAGGKTLVPLRVIVSKGGRFDPAWKVFTKADSPLLLCTGTPIPEREVRKFPSFVQFLELPGGTIAMRFLLELLRSHWGVKTLVCEGGPTLMGSLLEEDLVDELYLTVAPLIFGGVKAPGLTGLPGTFLKTERRFRLKEMDAREGEAFLHYIRARKRRA